MKLRASNSVRAIHDLTMTDRNMEMKMWLLTWFWPAFNRQRTWIWHVNRFAFVQFIFAPQVETTKAHNFLKIMTKSAIHPVVYNRIDHAVGHRQPIESQKQMRYIAFRCNVRLVVRINVKHVIRQPTYGEYCDYGNKHPYDLCVVFILFCLPSWVNRRAEKRKQTDKKGKKEKRERGRLHYRFYRHQMSLKSFNRKLRCKLFVFFVMHLMSHGRRRQMNK